MAGRLGGLRGRGPHGVPSPDPAGTTASVRNTPLEPSSPEDSDPVEPATSATALVTATSAAPSVPGGVERGGAGTIAARVVDGHDRPVGGGSKHSVRQREPGEV